MNAYGYIIYITNTLRQNCLLVLFLLNIFCDIACYEIINIVIINMNKIHLFFVPMKIEYCLFTMYLNWISKLMNCWWCVRHIFINNIYIYQHQNYFKAEVCAILFVDRKHFLQPIEKSRHSP